MISVTATEFIKGFGRHTLLVQREAIAVTSHGNVVGYYVSAHEYEEYQRLKRRQRQVIAAEDFTEAELEEMARAEVPAEAKAVMTDIQTLKNGVSYQGPVKPLDAMEAAVSADNRDKSGEEHMDDTSNKRKAYHISELLDELFEAAINAPMDSRHEHLNSLLEHEKHEIPPPLKSQGRADRGIIRRNAGANRSFNPSR